MAEPTKNPIIKTPYQLGIDIGFGDLKVRVSGQNGKEGVLKEKQFKFPSAVARARAGTIAGLENPQNEYSFEGKSYRLGNEALSSQRLIPTRDISFLVEFGPLLVYKAMEQTAKTYGYSMDTFLSSPKEICVGLPLEYYKGKRQEMIDRLGKFEVNGNEIDLSRRVDVRAQGQGILFDYLCSEPEHRQWFNGDKTMMILDIGHNTVDILCVDRGKASAEYSQMIEGGGICQVCTDLSAILKKMGAGERSEQEVKEALDKRQIVIQGTTVDLTKEIQTLSSDYADQLYREMRSRLQSFLQRSDKLIIAGGGAYFVYEQFVSNYPTDFVYCPSDAEYSNAKGYLEYLKGKSHGNHGRG